MKRKKIVHKNIFGIIIGTILITTAGIAIFSILTKGIDFLKEFLQIQNEITLWLLVLLLSIGGLWIVGYSWKKMTKKLFGG
ncbi:MAG: hypothetical protein U9R08_03720 [Nanoarchaeota archaeon]|nr:hypothetical protein [Nanoarchaeota archaeon]